MRLPWILAGLTCAAAAACANSDHVGTTFAVDTGGAGGMGGAGGGGGLGGAATSSSSTTSSSTTASSTTSSSSSTAASSSSSSGASSSSSSSSSSSGGACSYASPNTCDNALELSPVAGDTGSDVRTVSGTTSKWFKVHVTESSNFSNDLSYTVTLTPAPGVDFDVYVYEGDTMQTNCFAAAQQATGVPESFSNAWSDNFGSEDGRWINIEVRYAGGTGCGADAKWTLTVEGNKP